MFSSCVFYHENFAETKFSKDEFDSLRFLFLKFDLYLLPSSDLFFEMDNWQRAYVKLNRIMAAINSDAAIQSFSTLPEVDEPLANLDVFVNFPDHLKAKVDKLFPHRTFVAFSDVLTKPLKE
jgi:hypothetical protein